MQDLRIGIAGKRGLEFIAGFRAVPGARVTAFCEKDPEALKSGAARHGIRHTFSEIEQMLPDVDAVVVATPMQHHAQHSILCLNAGKHVLSEVTAAISLEECWKLLDAVNASNCTYMMAENYCFSRDNVLVEELVRQGFFGDLTYGEGEYLHEVRNLHHNPDGSPTWRHYWQVGARGCTYGTHSLGPVMRWINTMDPADRVEIVVCLGSGVWTDPEHPHDDTCQMLCNLRSGKLVRVRLDMMSNRPHCSAYYGLQGTRGVYEAGRYKGDVGRVWFGEGRDGDDRNWTSLREYDSYLPEWYRVQAEAAQRAGHGGGDYFIGGSFAQCVMEGTPPPIDIYQALDWTAAGLCSQVSIDNFGQPIRVPDFRDPAHRPAWFDDDMVD